jgi:geranylgeranyl pyrophosphate synthase
VNRIPIAQDIRPKIDKYNCINLKIFYILKEGNNYKNQETIYKMGENLGSYYQTKDEYLKYIKSSKLKQKRNK